VTRGAYFNPLVGQQKIVTSRFEVARKGQRNAINGPDKLHSHSRGEGVDVNAQGIKTCGGGGTFAGGKGGSI